MYAHPFEVITDQILLYTSFTIDNVDISIETVKIGSIAISGLSFCV